MSGSVSAATRDLVVEVLTEEDVVREIQPDWQQLAARCGAQPFGLPDMALAWWEHLGKGELAVVTARSASGELLGLAPFFRRSKAKLDLVSFLGNGLGAVGELLIDPGESKADVPGAIWSELFRRSKPVLQLTEFRHRGGGLQSLRRSEHWAVQSTLRDECPVIELGGCSSAEELLATPLRSGLRKKLNKAKRLVGDANLRLNIASEPGDILGEWERLGPLYDRAQEYKPRLHLGRGPFSPFFTQALHDLGANGQAAILSLDIDGAPAAFDVFVMNGSTAYAILGCFEPELSRYSPGQLLTQHGCQWALESGYSRIDLQLGADEYKLRWSANESYDTLGVVATAAGQMERTQLALKAIEVAHTAKQKISDLQGRLKS